MSCHDVRLAAPITGSSYRQMPTIGQSEKPAAGPPLRPFAQRKWRRTMSGRRETPDSAGVGRSYEELYVEHAPAARGLALSMLPPDVADDIVADRKSTRLNSSHMS